jgi:hypothetical protein
MLEKEAMGASATAGNLDKEATRGPSRKAGRRRETLKKRGAKQSLSERRNPLSQLKLRCRPHFRPLLSKEDRPWWFFIRRRKPMFRTALILLTLFFAACASSRFSQADDVLLPVRRPISVICVLPGKNATPREQVIPIAPGQYPQPLCPPGASTYLNYGHSLVVGTQPPDPALPPSPPSSPAPGTTTATGTARHP